jgi:protocatechuate 3,4-dioxygenase beta subunit
MNVTRRDFLRNSLIAGASLPLLVNCSSHIIAGVGTNGILDQIKRNANTNPSINWMGAIDAPASTTWETVLSGDNERGEPLEISGTVFNSDGRTPAPNTLIYFYHTDPDGFYGRNGQPRHGRFRGWLLTNEKGKYRFRTIKAAPYPEMRWAAHIHITVTTLAQKEIAIDSILFEGDRLISSQERKEAGRIGGFDPILTLTKGKDGILHGVRNIQLMA